jgi:heme exporter protein B
VSPDTALRAPALTAARLAVSRDLTLAFRRRSQLVQPLAFFVLVTLLFPLAISPELARLRSIAKTLAHWLLTGLPLSIMAPVAALSLGVGAAALPGILVSMVVGTATLSLIGALASALTLGMKRSGALLALITLPLSLPVLIYGARATELAIAGNAYLAPLELLAALAVLAVTLAPLAAAAAVRISLE